MPKRKNKSKTEVVHDIKQVQNVERMRKVVRESVFPFMLELNNTIGYAKIFLQTATTAVDTAFAETQRTVKVGDLIPTLEGVFGQNKDNKSETGKYIDFLNRMKDETVFDFLSMLQVMPRYIEQYYTHEADKQQVLDLPIDKILG